jgi:hypothetical protein
MRPLDPGLCSALSPLGCRTSDFISALFSGLAALPPPLSAACVLDVHYDADGYSVMVPEERSVQGMSDVHIGFQPSSTVPTSNLRIPALAPLRRDEVRPFQTQSLVHDRGGQVVILPCPHPVPALYRQGRFMDYRDATPWAQR